MNRYELAIEDMERMRKARAALKELTAWLDGKEKAAEAELIACESSPGIPLPQYRTFSLRECPAGRTDPHQCDCVAAAKPWFTREDTGTIQFSEA